MPPGPIPIFPLPTVVLFPNVYLPLHIFEPRYRQMIGDALSGDRIIGMTLLKSAADADDATPAVYPVGCSGVITHVERMPDGRFNIILRGIEKFRILDEEPLPPGRLYRIVHADPIDEPFESGDRAALANARKSLEERLAPLFERAQAESFLPQSMPDADLVNALAQYLEFDPLERQALLEQHGPLARCRAMLELLDVKALMDKASADTGTLH